MTLKNSLMVKVRDTSGISAHVLRARANDSVATKRGVPADYDGSNPELCNARSRSGRPCRALGLAPSGRCKWHGGKSTGPRTAKGKATVARNLEKARQAKLERQRAKLIADIRRWERSRVGYDPATGMLGSRYVGKPGEP